MNHITSVLAVAVLAYVLAESARVVRLVRIGRALAMSARVYTNTTGRFSVLVLGDSTAVGVGATDPEESVAGRLCSLLDASVENYARSGATVSDLLRQRALAKREHYDLILIQAGGNDIIKLHSLRESSRTMQRLLSVIEKKSERIALLTAGRIGYAPFFPKLIAPLMTSRSLILRSLFIRIAQKNNVLYVDLLGMSSVLNSDPARYYAADMLHLSGAGYGVWFEKLESEMRARWPELFTSRAERIPGVPYRVG